MQSSFGCVVQTQIEHQASDSLPLRSKFYSSPSKVVGSERKLIDEAVGVTVYAETRR